jgi:hypothetical protein
LLSSYAAEPRKGGEVGPSTKRKVFNYVLQPEKELEKMRRVWPLVALLSVGLVTMAESHSRGGELFFAVQFPDANIPAVDGDLSDWAMVPDVPYVIGSELMGDFVYGTGERGEMDVSDMSIRAIWGWNDNNERLYLMAEVFDDVHVADRDTPNAWWADDAWEIYIEPNHLGPEEEGYGYVGGLQSFNMSVPIASDNLGQMLPPHEWKDDIDDGINWGFGWSFEGEIYGESTYFYELWIQSYDFTPEDGNLDGTIFSEFDVEDIIHMSMAFDDDDDGGTERTGYWATTDSGGC